MRSADHKRAIALAKIREGYKCEICGSDLDIHGHHMLDFAFGGEATSDNILVVCKKCHDQVHTGDIVIHTFDFRPNKDY